MKRHTQIEGVRNWYGEDLLDLQNEPLKLVDEYFSQYGDCIISGCQMIQYQEDGRIFYEITPGQVAMQAQGPSGPVNVVAKFYGINSLQNPKGYIYIKRDTVNGQYKDGGLKPVFDEYVARFSAIKPDVSHMEFEFGKLLPPRFHNHVVDHSSRNLNGEYDYIVDDINSLKALHNNAAATCVLVKKGVYITNGISINLHPYCRKIVGETGVIFRETYDGEADDSPEYLFNTGTVTDIRIENIRFEVNCNATFSRKYLLIRISHVSNCHFTFNVTGTDLKDVEITALMYCYNIDNCNIVVNDYGLSSGARPIINGIRLCVDIAHCKILYKHFSDTTGNVIFSGIYSSQNISNCFIGIRINNPETSIYAFRHSHNIMNSGCDYTAKAEAGEVYLFYNSYYQTNCWAKDNSSLQTNPVYYTGCHYLNNCQVKTWDGETAGFSSCGNLINCRTNGIYNRCYSSLSYDVNHLCDATLNGGWNVISSNLFIPSIFYTI